MSDSGGARELGAVYGRIAALATSAQNDGALPGATHEATRTNPLCGDRVTIRLVVAADVVRAARFEMRGCALARASAALLTDAVVGCSVVRVLTLVTAADALLAGKPSVELGVLEALRGAHLFPARSPCLALAWRSLEAAIGSAGAGPV